MRRFFVLTAVGAMITSSAFSATTLNSAQDKLSYAMGVTTGSAFRSHNIPVNASAFEQGLQDAMSGSKLQMSDQEIRTTLMDYQKSKLKEMQAQYDSDSSSNAKKSADFLAQNKKDKGVVTLADGLQYKVLREGKGASPTVNDTVVVNYEGKLMNGQVFDSSYKRGEPASFPLNGVVKGWQEALTLMKPGAMWMIYLPPELAYGKQGVPGLIGPNETLIFKVELLNVKK